MQAAIQLILSEIKNVKTYQAWAEERLRTGDLQDSTVEFYDNEAKACKVNLAEYRTALAVLTKANRRGRFYVQAISYILRLRNHITRLLGPRFPITVDSIQLETGKRSDKNSHN